MIMTLALPWCVNFGQSIDSIVIKINLSQKIQQTNIVYELQSIYLHWLIHIINEEVIIPIFRPFST
jgi:hypothetical protein